MKKIAILGGGYAGMAAAVELAAAGVPVTVFEAGKVLGGRARKVTLEGREVDNGQHLLIGAYGELLRLMQTVGVDPEMAFLRQPLELAVEPGFRLACPRLPAPLHLAAGLLLARGLSVTERWCLIMAIRGAENAGWMLPADCTVSVWLQQNRQPDELIARFWQPLTVAALNTPIEKASTQVLLNVLRDSLGGAREASDLLFPKLDFSALFPEAAARFVEAHGGEVRLGAMVKSLRRADDGWQVGEGEERFSAVICALPPHRAGMVMEGLPELTGLAAQLEAWEYQPIVTVYLQYAADVHLSRPMTGLADSLAQWVFDRGYTHATPGLIAVVISAEGEHQKLGREALMAAVERELHARLGLPAQAEWRGMIAEKRATFACVPEMQRPSHKTAAAGLLLAGDYTQGQPRDYPATLEGAVRSGVGAARELLARL
ncbi:squalene-associated FAD-dependent desaturase [Formivibrio citricus]|uniref:Squalene-associated FAD-dependent desaturase n=1 Tax=Formivibrio citricus TaxID=83765 RepID=A0A1I4W8H0_9NEIS|nr:hydroxysqualene dehydroxylase HpnE [Formivibrio citricus]SFN09735.1 squalene-associated FAD-dependent desaturase [Formivibrio citricus]